MYDYGEIYNKWGLKMKYHEYNKHVFVLTKTKIEIKRKLEMIEPDKKMWYKLFMCNSNIIIRKLYLDYLILEELEDEALNIEI